MDPFTPRGTKKDGPEATIQKAIVRKLQGAGWFVKSTHGNEFQSGFPDLFAAHEKFGQRWIEVKNPGKYSFTAAQIIDFPKFFAAGVGIWIITSDSDHEIQKLFKPANWLEFYLNYVNGGR